MQILEFPPDIRLEFLAEGAANIVYKLIFPPCSPTINSDIRLEFLAEGAANIVYKLILPPCSPTINSEIYFEDEEFGPDTPPPTETPMLRWDPLLTEKLLRLRKDLPTATSVFEAQHSFEEHIEPNFSNDHLVEQILIRLPPGLIKTCNEELRSMEAGDLRPEKRHGVYLSTSETYGIVVMDMSPRYHGDMLSIEFKPKWLAQSPSAPKGATRCRTCALRKMRIAQYTDSSKLDTAVKESFCPLDLVSDDKDRVADVVDSILRDSVYSEFVNKSVSSDIFDFIYQSPLLLSLKEQQTKLDPGGVFAVSNDNIDLMIAMTLRDCTLFLHVRGFQLQRSPQ